PPSLVGFLQGLANEDDRKKRRRERNKIAAAKCRSKKKEKTETLAQESQRLEGHNSNLRSQLEAMLGEKQRLVQLINMHRPSCIVHA
uniref:Activating transcription factor 3 n=1 Tax=Petromyzon marinus TaxID=7757 RepID=S4R5J4_PETMA